MTKLVAFYRSARKAAVPVVGLVGQAVALGLLHGTALAVASLILWAAAAAGVYGVRNASAVNLGGINLGVEGTVLTMTFSDGRVLSFDKATGKASYSGTPLRSLIIGEKGPELVDLPAGSAVFPAPVAPEAAKPADPAPPAA